MAILFITDLSLLHTHILNDYIVMLLVRSNAHTYSTYLLLV